MDTTDYHRIEKAIRYLMDNFKAQPSLDEVAEQVHLSSYHFQRIFSDWAGISPKRFTQFLTTKYLKNKIHLFQNMPEAADDAGLSGSSRLHDLFVSMEGVTPQEYKQHGEGVEMEYGIHESPFGKCLLATSKRGISWFSFITESEEKSVAEMKAFWGYSTWTNRPDKTQKLVQKVFSKERDNRFHLFVKGTNFQIKVWEALLRIPFAGVSSYQQIGEKIQQPRATQAIGSAVGANHIAYLIPCHRVIRQTGVLGEYRWHEMRKKCLLGWEEAQQARE